MDSGNGRLACAGPVPATATAPALSIVRATSVVIRRSIAVPPGPGYDRPSLAKSTDAFTASGPCPPHSAELVRPAVRSLGTGCNPGGGATFPFRGAALTTPEPA